jgi:hypothetical protein
MNLDDHNQWSQLAQCKRRKGDASTSGPTEMLSHKVFDEVGEVKYGVTVFKEVHRVNERGLQRFRCYSSERLPLASVPKNWR